MIYISISAQALEVISTSKNLFQRIEKITSVSRKILTPENNLSTAISDALKTAYPSPIKQVEAKLVVPDQELVIKRIKFDQSLGNISTDSMIQQAKNILPTDIANYENFYKEINLVSPPSVLYTAMLISKIKHYADIINNCGLKLVFLSSSSFSIYALLKPILKMDSKLIYLSIDSNLEFIILDSEGPIEVIYKKTSSKTINTDIKDTLKKIKTEYANISELIIAGESSLELNTDELSTDTGIEVKKITSQLENILMSQKINLDTGGVPSLYFDKVLGLLNLSKMTEVPNFALDLKNILSKPITVDLNENIVTSSDEVEDTKLPPVIKMEVEEKTEEPERVLDQPKYNLEKTSNNRSLLVIIFIGIALILFGGFLLIGKSSIINLPSFSRPTLTPTVTPSPTLTPTPTVDPSLKRSDIKLRILNGTDKTGFAKQASESLKDLGYKNIATGNADNSDYQNTVIKIKEAKKHYLPLIINDIKNQFDTSTVVTLETDSSQDVILILGQK